MSIPLPPTEIRQGGGPLRFDDDHFRHTADEDVEFLKSVGLSDGMALIDLGCGPARLAVGLIRAEWSGSYLGIEVNPRHVEWADQAITPRFPDFRFEAVDAQNDRYNPTGGAPRRLPVADASIDFICAFSVFSHMLPVETSHYLAEFARVLESAGRAYITAYVAAGVDDVTENPPGRRRWKGRLHCVQYSTEYITRLIAEAGLVLEARIDRPGRVQNGLLLRRAD